MKQQLALTTLLVPDYDEGIAFFVDTLGFELRQDTRLAAEKRWVVVAPPGSSASLLLARAATERQRDAIGDQAGGRVFLFLHTDDFERDHAQYSAKGVVFLEEPRREDYGLVAVFQDPFGNRWDLIGPSGSAGPVEARA